MGVDDPMDALALDIGQALQGSGTLKRRDGRDKAARHVLAHLRHRGWQIGRKRLDRTLIGA